MTVLITRDFLASVLSVLSSLGAGCVFLLAGILKLLSPSAFLRHVTNLKLPLVRGLPWAAMASIAGLLAVAECVLGVALLVRIFPDRVFPFSVGVLAVLGAVTIWSASTGRSDNCGCYGNLLILTPRQSTLLTALYAALVATAWRFPTSFSPAPSVQVGVLIGSVAFFAGIAVVSMWSHMKFGQDLLNTSPLKPRRRWNPAWLEGFAEHANGRAQMVVLISPDCPVCKTWIEPLNKVTRRPGMPQLIAGIVTESGTIDGFRNEFNVKFPLLPVKAGTMARLVLAYPTLVAVEDGLITSVSIGQLPPDLLNQLRRHTPSVPGLPADAGVAAPDPLEYVTRR